MCICINCKHVKNCTTYKIILIEHNQPIPKKNKNNIVFTPNNTLIQININQALYSNSIKYEWDLVECSSFVEKPGFWLSS
uniref:hypothetical protein n=1 Tax=Hypnea wynnei TaxID=1867777 RepID=UPI0027DA9F11|nr:hypothetical protein REP92_pgp133 [Hypnea wynnei]WCH56494.1 hypothetical protein [Hypnea wynnei]